MKLILLSGGSGKRLWPLSNDVRSKQFLKVLEEDNYKVSMVQRVWNQLKRKNLEKSTIIATSKTQEEIILGQLTDDIPLVIEPERRDTFPAIALSVLYLMKKQNINKDETITVLPVDPYVNDDFFDKIVDLDLVLEESGADLALIGVKPTYPSSKYGYIIPDDIQNSNLHFIKVKSFKEKPSELEAEILLQQKAYWNCGIFAFKAKYIYDILVDNGLPTDYQKFNEYYHKMNKNSFDYEVVEKAKKVVALPYNGTWKDLGTWNTLTEEMSTNITGKGNFINSYNTHIINELDIPINVIGADNFIIAASPDGILVSDKSKSPEIKDMIKDYKYDPMYEERAWGWSRTLDYASYGEGQEMITRRICINKGKNSSYHYHNLRDEVWTIVKGKGELIIDGVSHKVQSGDTIHLPSKKKHGIYAIEELEFIEIQTGLSIAKDDHIRLESNWEIIKNMKEYKPRVII